jgi:hypothetical protein
METDQPSHSQPSSLTVIAALQRALADVEYAAAALEQAALAPLLDEARAFASRVADERRDAEHRACTEFMVSADELREMIWEQERETFADFPA